jgi:hypothetical protein
MKKWSMQDSIKLYELVSKKLKFTGSINDQIGYYHIKLCNNGFDVELSFSTEFEGSFIHDYSVEYNYEIESQKEKSKITKFEVKVDRIVKEINSEYI